MLRTYKADQGRMARMFAFWSVVGLLLFGCMFAHAQLERIDDLARPLGGLRIPIVGIDVTGAFLIAAAVFVVGVILIQRWQQKPRMADLLIDTESELRKVTWPTAQEVVNTSIVVFVCVAALFGCLAFFDWIIGYLVKYLVLGRV